MEPKNKLSNLSAVELHIYNYIMSNTRFVSNMTIHELAKNTNTSTASILRFCRKYGCSGFSEFKVKLKQEIQLDAFKFQPKLGNSLHDFQKFFLKTATSEEFNKSIDKAAQLIANKDLIIFVGLGSSNIMAEYGALYFSYLFNLSFRVEDITEYPIELFNQNLIHCSCMIVLSISGDTKEIVDYVKNNYIQGMNLVVISANENSVLSSLANISITYPFPISGNTLSNTTSQIPCCFIIELLAQKIQAIRYNNVNEKETAIDDEILE